MKVKQRIFTKLRIVVLICAAAFVGKAHAATYGAQIEVSPMPFSPGQTVSITANVSGPFSNATEYVAVSDGTKIVFNRTVLNLGAVAKGQTKKFAVPWPVDTERGLCPFRTMTNACCLNSSSYLRLRRTGFSGPRLDFDSPFFMIVSLIF